MPCASLRALRKIHAESPGSRAARLRSDCEEASPLVLLPSGAAPAERRDPPAGYRPVPLECATARRHLRCCGTRGARHHPAPLRLHVLGIDRGRAGAGRLRCCRSLPAIAGSPIRIWAWPIPSPSPCSSSWPSWRGFISLFLTRTRDGPIHEAPKGGLDPRNAS